MDALGERPVSQRDLVGAWEELDGGKGSGRLESAWLDSGPLTWQAPLREEGATASFVRAEDIDGRQTTREEAIRASIPMLLPPVLGELRRWERLHGHFVAPRARIDYSPMWGASWQG